MNECLMRTWVTHQHVLANHELCFTVVKDTTKTCMYYNGRDFFWCLLLHSSFDSYNASTATMTTQANSVKIKQ